MIITILTKKEYIKLKDDLSNFGTVFLFKEVGGIYYVYGSGVWNVVDLEYLKSKLSISDFIISNIPKTDILPDINELFDISWIFYYDNKEDFDKDVANTNIKIINNLFNSVQDCLYIPNILFDVKDNLWKPELNILYNQNNPDADLINEVTSFINKDVLFNLIPVSLSDTVYTGIYINKIYWDDLSIYLMSKGVPVFSLDKSFHFKTNWRYADDSLDFYKFLDYKTLLINYKVAVETENTKFFKYVSEKGLLLSDKVNRLNLLRMWDGLFQYKNGSLDLIELGKYGFSMKEVNYLNILT